MNRMTTQKSQFTTSKTALVSPSHEQFIPERMKKVNLFARTLGVLVLILASSLGVFGQTITSFTPISGAVGSTVTITGTNFSSTAANNVVYFGGVKANVTSATSTQLTVTVPDGDSRSRIQVVNVSSNLSCISKGYFTVRNAINLVTTGMLSIVPQTTEMTNNAGISNSQNVFITDINADGIKELSSVRSGNTLNVLQNTTSSFAPTKTSITLDQGVSQSTNTFFCDFNNDGKVDLFTHRGGGQGSGWVFMNTSTSGMSFGSGTDLMANGGWGFNGYDGGFGDLNKDGKVDIIGAYWVDDISTFAINTSTNGSWSSTYQGDGQATYSGSGYIGLVPGQPLGVTVSNFATADFNGDGFEDYIVSSSSNTWVVLNSNTTIGSTTIGLSPTSLSMASNLASVGDFDNDGDNDFIIAQSGGNIQLFTNNGSGAFTNTDLGISTNGFKLSDFDGDGLLDIINFASGSYSFIKNITTSSISFDTQNAVVLVTDASATGEFVVFDFNNDGEFDIASIINQGYRFFAKSLTSVAATPTTLSNFSTCAGIESATQTTSVDGSGLTGPLVVTAPSGYEVSTNATTGFASSVSLTPTSGTVAATTIYVRLAAATAAGTYNANLTVASTGATTVNVALTGVVNANPVLTITNPAASCSPSTVDLTSAAVTSGSTGTFTLSYWTNAGATTTLASPSSAAAGTYYIKATTSAGCTDIEPVTAVVNTPISSVSIAVIDQPCGNTATGSATVTLTGGVAPFTYAWTRNGTSFTATPANAPTNLTAANAPGYVLTVSDACGSSTSNTITLTNAPSLTLNSAVLGSNALCNGGNGTLVGVIQGGTNPRTLTATNTLNNTLVYSSSTPSATPAPGQFQYTLNVPAGTYTVSASDGLSSCVSTFNTTISVSQPTTITSTVAKTDVCFGGTNGTITVTASGGTGALQYSIDGGTTYQASNSFTGLSANAYSVVVKDANNCTTTPSSITINQSGSALAVAVTSVTNVACNGASTGAVNITASGGYNTAYTYAWTGPSSFNATTEDLTNRPAGTYNVTVTDAGGCTAQATATLTQPTAVTATIASTNVSCNGGNNGSAVVTVNGGVGPYTYSWSDANGPITIPAVVAEANSPALQGWYTMIGQSFDQMMQTWGQTQSAGQTFTSVGGQLTAIQTHIWGVDYAGNFTFTLYSGAGNTGSILSQQTVAINASGNLTITLPTPITLTAGQQYTFVFSGTQVSARLSITSNQYAGGGSFAQNSNGTTIVNGTNDTWFINSYAAVPATSLSNLTAGTYNVTVTDANGCTFTTSTTITQPTALSASATSTNLTCNLSANGSITVAATGGTAPYTYSTDGTTFASSANITGLAAATYTVTVKDANNCQTTINGITITEPAVLAASISAQTNNTCFGESLGSATVSVTGGTSAYSYSWNSTPVQTSATATTLPAGSYVVSITDASGCTTSATATITQPTQVAATVTSTNVLCNGGSTGSITVTGASGGIAPYQYSINGGTSWQSSNTFSGLTAGTYNVQIKDNGGVQGTPPTPAVIPTTVTNDIWGRLVTYSNVNLNGQGNTLNIAPGGTVNISYGYSVSLSGSVYCPGCVVQSYIGIGGTTSTVQCINPISNGTNGTFNGSFTAPSTPGIYYLTQSGTLDYVCQPQNFANNSSTAIAAIIITANSGCIVDLDGVSNTTITEPLPLTASAVKTNVGCFGAATGTVTATAAGGTTPYTYSLNGGTYQSSNIFTALVAGTYTVTVKDANNCTVNTSAVTITQPASALAAGDDGISPASCSNVSDGAIPITVTGGTAPYSYSWTGPNGFTSSVEDQVYNLAAGSYNVTVTDANSCSVTLSGLVITSPPAINISTTSSNVTCYQGSDGAINATVTGGSPSFAYQWKKNGVNFATTEDLTGLSTGSYVLTVTDGNFCQNNTPAIVIIDNPQIVATVAANAASICSGTNAVFTITGTVGNVVTYNLNGGSNTTATIAAGGTATVTVTAATTAQTINLVSVSNGACSNAISGTAAVTINALPTANAGADQTVCAGASVTLSGAGTGTYSWNNSVSNGVAFTAVNATTTAITTTYTLTVTNANGCTATDQVDVTVNPIPSIYAGQDATVCEGTSITLSGESCGITTAANLNGVTNVADDNGMPQVGQSFTAITGGTLSAIKLTLWPTGAPQLILRDYNGNVLSSAFGGAILATSNVATNMPSFANWQDLSTFEFTNGPTLVAGQQYTFEIINHSGTYTGLNDTYAGGQSFHTLNQGFAGDMNFAVEICQPNNSVAYSWDNGVINNVAFTAVNGTSASVSTTYTLSVTASGCTNTDQINVTVNPTPTVNNFTAQTVCAGSTNAAVVPTGAVTGTNYAWTNTNTSIGLAASGTGTIPSFTAVNAGTTAQTATVTVTPSYGGNMGTVFGEANENGTVTLNAPAGTYFTGVQFASWGTPTGTLGNYSIGSCHAANSSNVVAGLAVGQTTVTIPANNATFGNPCGGVGKSLAVVLTYGTFGSTCSGTAKTYTITVNPTPVVSNKTATICSGSAFTATTGGSDVVPAGTQYTWTVAANANVTGASNQTTATSTISQTLTNTTNTVQTVVYTVTPISGTCSGATFTVTVTVNPTPALTSTLTPSALCAPNFFSYTAVSPTVAATGSTVLSWVRQANVGIHEAPTSGTGNINGDLLTNITNNPVTVIYDYTVTSNGCSANYSVNVVANPMPYQGFAYNQGAWSGIGHWAGGPFSNTQISAQTFVHNINKPVNSVSVVLNSIGAVGTFPITATIRTVDVNGIPTSTILGTSTITASFTGGMVNYTFPFASPISLGVGTQYAVVFSMSGGAFPVDGPPSAYDSYPYGYIYLSNDNGSSWYQVANDRDMLFSMTYVETICSNNTFTYNFTSPTVGATATWSRPAVIGISQPAATGTGSISEVLTNSTNNVITVPYTYAITANGCTRNETVYVRVNPAPALSSTLTPAAICSNSTFTYVPSSTTQLTSGSYGFTWSRAAVAGISQVASSGSGSINEVLTNTTFLPVTVTYVYTISANGCSATNNVTVVVNPSPVIAAKTNNACSGVAITLAPANGSGDVVPTGTTYTWTVVDNPNVIGETNANTAQTSIVQTLVNNYTSAQQVVYTVTPTFNGCAGTPFTYTVTVSTPVAVAALTGATNVCLGSTTQLASATAGGVWTSSNTAVATISATGVVTGLTTGTTTISYTVTNSVGCTGVVTANVNVNALPVATITPSGSTTICQGSSVTLTASAGSLYLWSNGLQTSSITVSTAGNYSVQVTNAAGCVTTSAVTAVVVNPLPIATITANGPTTFCQGGTVTLTASAGSSYLWSNGATTSSITVNASGCYSVTVTNANGCSATSACTQVTVNALPVASISSLNGTSFCQGGSVTLVSTPGSTYAWSNNLTTQSINVTASANLTVTVTNAAGCSSTSAPFAVTMNPLPTATITAGGPLTFCQGGSVVLTAGGGTSFAWTNSTSTASSITVSTSGVYTVTATNANGCSATSAPVTVTVNALPVVAAIAGSNDVCVGSTTILTNATSGGVWSSSNASAATVSASGVVTGVAAGVATINYTVTNTSGCVTTSSLVINVNAVPVNIPIGGPNTVCVGSTITNFANPGGVWSSSNVSIATVAQNGIITGVAAGTATISYTITNAAGCSSTVTKVVTVNALPTVAVAANGPLTFCQGGSVTLTASGGTSYAWSNSTATTPSITVTTSGSYTVTATNANGCFATSAPVVVNVLALPNAAIASTGSNICLGNTTTLTASGGVSYSWSNGAPTASITVNNSNTYTVTVTGANGCTATASNVVTVNANPAVVVTANAPLTFCQGGSVTLSATGAASYVWSNGTLGSTNVITQSGTYYAQGTNAAGCTSNSAVITVTVLPTPVVAALTGANTVCEASTITLSSATPGGVWSTSNSFVATVNNAGVITGMNAGTAVITYTLSNGACNASVSASVTVLNSPATPVITAGGPTTVCPNETVQLFSSNAPNYQWNSGPQTNNILVTESGSYTVTVVGSNGCAVTSLPMTVTIGDDIDPIIVAPINVNVNPNLGCTAVGVALGTPIVSDNCTVASVTNNAPALFPIGTTTVTWTVTDASGNSATATQLVNVVDQVAPEATAPAHVTVNTNNFCDATGVNLGTPEATDNCTIASITNDAPASFPIGTTVVTWTITDATGNFTTVTQNVTVVDTEAPVVVLQSAAVQLDANGVGILTFEAIDNGSSDNCGIAAVSIDQTTFDCGQVGFNTVTVTITDNSGNQTSAEVVINVIASDACGGTDVAGPNVPDAFTPNGNSINDTWVIPGLEGYNTKQMAVYSRYGTLVYYSSAYANDWDGTLMGNGVAVPDGTYYYTLTLDGGKQLSGYVYINRVKQ